MNDEIATLKGLVSEYSPSGNEKSATEWLVSHMAKLGYTQSFTDQVGNAIGVMGNGQKQLVLLGHIDTVPGKIAVRIEDGKLYGRGSVDAKGPLACFVDAVAKVGPIEGWQFIVIGATEEERDSDGARHIARQYKPDFAIIGEPNRWERICLGYKGSAWASITIRTEQFHSAHAEESACEMIVNKWIALKSFASDFNAKHEKMFDQLLLTMRSMESGTDGFEQFARISVGARLPIDISPAEWYEKLVELAEGALVEPKGFAIPAWICEKNTPLVRATLSSIRAHGGTPSFVFKSGTADLNIVAPHWKCPTIVYGPGDSALDHTPGEHISIEEYQKAVMVLSASLINLTNMK